MWGCFYSVEFESFEKNETLHDCPKIRKICHSKIEDFKCKAPNFPHLLIYGPSGAGKKTRIFCILKELYGPTAENVRI